METFIYKTLTPEDAERWRALRLEGVRDFPLGFLTTLEEAEADRVARCREILGHGALRGLFSEAQLVGFCGYRPQRLARTRHRCEIGPFFITAGFQGRGAAQALMRGVLAEAKAAGIAQVELFVDSENRRAIAFYKREGFEQVATLPDTLRIDGVSRQDHFLTRRL